MKRFTLSLGVAFLSATAPAQEPVTTTTEQELSSPGDFNGDGLVDVALVDRASGEIRAGLQQANGTWSWISGSSGIDGASLLAVGPFLGNPGHVVAVASKEFNRIQLWNPIGNQQATWNQSGIGLGVLALHAPAGTPLLAVTDQNTAPAALLAHAFNSAGNAVDTVLPSTDGSPLAWGNPIQRRAGQNRRVAAMQGRRWICVSLDSPGTVLRSGLPDGSRFVTGRFASGQSESMAVFWKPGSSDIQISIHNSLALNSWSDGPNYAFAQPLHSLVVIDGQPPQLLALFDGGTNGALYTFANQTPSQVTQALTAPPGQPVTTAFSTGKGAFNLLNGPNGSSESSTHWTLEGATWKQDATTPIPPVSPTAGRANVFLFSAEPLVTPKAVLLNRQKQGDWSGQGGALSGNSRTIATERFVDPQQGLRPNGSATISDATARYALVNQLLPAASAASLVAGVGAPIGDIRFTPPPGRYPDINAARGERLSISLTPTKVGEEIFYRSGGQGAWTLYAEPVELAASTTLQAYSKPLGGKPGHLRNATYTFVGRPTDLAAPPSVDADQNGLADAWETAFAQHDPNADTDGDGANALAEQNAGTDPQDPASRPVIDNPRRILSLSTATGPDGPILRLDWTADAGPIVLQSSPDLLTWSDVVPQPNVRSYEILIQTTRLFFRLREP